MSEQLQSTVDSSREPTPIAEFRRWLIMACVLSIVGTCLLLALDGPRVGHRPQISFTVFWLIASACEGWLLFSDWPRKLSWLLGGALTGWFLSGVFLPNSRESMLLMFTIPATIEFFTARGVRHRPWAWLIGTFILYGSLPLWAPLVGRTARKVTTLAFDPFDYPTVTQLVIASVTSVLAVALMSRAIVGAFIASRKVT